MTREMNSGLSAEGKSVAYPFNADNQEKPDWHNKWKDKYSVPLGEIEVREYKKKRTLDEWIKPFFDNCCRMERLK